MAVGSKPVDGGHYIFDEAARASFIAREPKVEAFVHPFLGGHEFINGDARYILVASQIEPALQRQMPSVLERMSAVRRFREQSTGNLARELAGVPTQFHVTVLPDAPFLSIPEVSSSRREYIPIGWLNPPVVPSNKILVVQHADIYMFAIVTSRMHMSWVRNIGGRLKNDYQYSSGMVYNPFPWPDVDESSRARINNLAQAVLDARTNHLEATLADLYDPDTMPPDLRRAHQALDQAVDRLYRKEPFATDRERVEHLLKLYENLTAPMLVAANAKPKRGPKIKSELAAPARPGARLASIVARTSK
jgi:hypothetical protein